MAAELGTKVVGGCCLPHATLVGHEGDDHDERSCNRIAGSTSLARATRASMSSL
jgi:hypothetical protein